MPGCWRWSVCSGSYAGFTKSPMRTTQRYCAILRSNTRLELAMITKRLWSCAGRRPGEGPRMTMLAGRLWRWDTGQLCGRKRLMWRTAGNRKNKRREDVIRLPALGPAAESLPDGPALSA